MTQPSVFYDFLNRLYFIDLNYDDEVHLLKWNEHFKSFKHMWYSKIQMLEILTRLNAWLLLNNLYKTEYTNILGNGKLQNIYR